MCGRSSAAKIHHEETDAMRPVLIFCCIGLSGCVSQGALFYRDTEEAIRAASVIDGQMVTVCGDLAFHVEGNVLCAPAPNVPNDLASYCIEVSFDGDWEDQYQRYGSLEDQNVCVQGRFSRVELAPSMPLKDNGHLPLQIGPNFHQLRGERVAARAQR